MKPDESLNTFPEIIVVGGPNGAGKSTTAARIVPYGLNEGRFLNADFIARGISPHDPDRAAIAAGRVMLNRMHELVASGTSFSFESTLASRGLARILAGAKDEGYIVRVGYVSLALPALSVNRVAQRVAKGGHNIPTADIVRRYWRSLANFHRLYLPLADAWTLYDNGSEAVATVASQRRNHRSTIHDQARWRRFEELRAQALL